MDANLLTIVERAGGSGLLSSSATLKEREALALHLGALRAAGHAVVADEVFERPGNSGSLGIRVLHYLNCRVCKEHT